MDKIILTGNLGRDAELRAPEGLAGKSVVNFSVAVRRGYGETERTVWYACAWWGERAAKCAAWLTKGRQVLIEGSPEARAWLPRGGGEPRAEVAVTVHFLEFIGNRRSDDGAGDGAATRPVNESPVGAGAAASAGADEDVPY